MFLALENCKLKFPSLVNPGNVREILGFKCDCRIQSIGEKENLLYIVPKICASYICICQGLAMSDSESDLIFVTLLSKYVIGC